MIRRSAVIGLLTIAAIAIHESGHYLIYTLAGYPVIVTLQSVRVATAVPRALDLWAKAAGPLVSLAAAVCLFWISRRRGGFVWVTAAFTNATLRLFPLAMDLVRAVQGRPAFSDEGEVAMALSGGTAGRLAFLGGVAAFSLLLSILIAREYRFEGHVVLKLLAVYMVSLAVGIAVVLVDEILR